MIKGKNPTLLSVTYVKPDKKNGQKECFQVIYTDDHGHVHYTEEKAEADIYIVKPEYRNYTWNKPQERIERMDKVTCLISKIPTKIADAAGKWGERIMETAYEKRDFRMLKQLYKWPYCYACDFQPEYYYMKNWYEKYPYHAPKLTKAFMDIETDVIDHTVDFDHISSTAYAPVNCVTIILEATKESYTFILRPYLPPKNGMNQEEYDERYQLYVNQFEMHKNIMKNKQDFIDYLNKEFDQTYGHINYHLREYEHEIDLIADVFRLINDRKPNFCLIWNMRFDIQYLIERIQVLGYDPRSIICSPEIPHKKCYFRVDKSTWLLEKQFDYFYCTSYTQYLCQMRTYASIRKSQHKLRSVKLNDIAERELGDKKVDYEDIAGNIALFPYHDWFRYIVYNVKD